MNKPILMATTFSICITVGLPRSSLVINRYHYWYSGGRSFWINTKIYEHTSTQTGGLACRSIFKANLQAFRSPLSNDEGIYLQKVWESASKWNRLNAKFNADMTACCCFLSFKILLSNTSTSETIFLGTQNTTGATLISVFFVPAELGLLDCAVGGRGPIFISSSSSSSESWKSMTVSIPKTKKMITSKGQWKKK